MKKQQRRSFKRSLLAVWMIVAIPLLVLLLFYNYVSMKIYSEKYIISSQSSLELHAQRFERDLASLDSLLSGIAASNYFSTFSTATTPLQAHNMAYTILSQYRTTIRTFGNEPASSLFIYNCEQTIYRDVFSENYDYQQQMSIRLFLQTLPYEQWIDYSNLWVSVEIDHHFYLLRMLQQNQSFAAITIDLSQLIKHSNQPDNYMTYLNTEKQPLDQSNFLSDHVIQLNKDLSKPYFSGHPTRFLVLCCPLSQTNLHLLLLVPQSNPLSHLKGIQLFFPIAGIITFILLIFSYHRLKNHLLSPMSHLIHNLNSNYTNSQQEYLIDEFKQVDDRVSQLKLKAYQNELERQKAQMQYLQLQLRPHFFLNCLKSLYGMAQRKKYEQIQEMILAISNHLRYYFQDNLQLVPLKQEISHVINYMNIQKMGLYISPICETSLDSNLETFLVPPLLLQTFVENSVKYAMYPNQQLKIFIKATKLTSEDGDYADIVIHDNGNGFSEDALEKLNGDTNELFLQKHIGINNILQRLKLLYHQKAVTVFFNDEGAVVEIILPIETS